METTKLLAPKWVEHGTLVRREFVIRKKMTVLREVEIGMAQAVIFFVSHAKVSGAFATKRKATVIFATRLD